MSENSENNEKICKKCMTLKHPNMFRFYRGKLNKNCCVCLDRENLTNKLRKEKALLEKVEDENLKKCNQCKKLKTFNMYKKRGKSITKTCTICLNYNLKRRKKSENNNTKDVIEKINDDILKKCSGCKKLKTSDMYREYRGKINKNCTICLDKNTKSRNAKKSINKEIDRKAEIIRKSENNTLKNCTKCNTLKDINLYREFRGSLNDTCNSCLDYDKNHRKIREDKNTIEAKNSIEGNDINLKRCIKCKIFVDIILFENYGKYDIKIKKVCISCCKKRLCEHKIYKGLCAICNKKTFCIHNKRPRSCKECKGSDFCSHDKVKKDCKVCNKNFYCIHDKNRSSCQVCNPNLLCDHNIIKYECTICSKTRMCVHKIRKIHCKVCSPKSFCPHGTRKRRCIKCKGSAICIHEIIKYKCVICTPKKACQNCFSIYIDNRSKYKPHCFNCYCVLNPEKEIVRRYKIKETYLQQYIKEEFKEYIDDKKITFDKQIASGCSKRRPDIRIECLTHSIIVECDENQHSGYSCENKRTMELFQDLGNRPLVIIRFNPDKYKINGKSIKSCFEETSDHKLIPIKIEWYRRLSLLKTQIIRHVNNIPIKEVLLEHLFYDEQTN